MGIMIKQVPPKELSAYEIARNSVIDEAERIANEAVPPDTTVNYHGTVQPKWSPLKGAEWNRVYFAGVERLYRASCVDGMEG